jgi:hypothetical protein
VPRGSTASTGARGAIFHLSVVGVLWVPHVVGGVGPRLPTAVAVARLPAAAATAVARLPAAAATAVTAAATATAASKFAEGPCSSRRRREVGGAIARGHFPRSQRAIRPGGDLVDDRVVGVARVVR